MGSDDHGPRAVVNGICDVIKELRQQKIMCGHILVFLAGEPEILMAIHAFNNCCQYTKGLNRFSITSLTAATQGEVSRLIEDTHEDHVIFSMNVAESGVTLKNL